MTPPLPLHTYPIAGLPDGWQGTVTETRNPGDWVAQGYAPSLVTITAIGDPMSASDVVRAGAHAIAGILRTPGEAGA